MDKSINSRVGTQTVVGRFFFKLQKCFIIEIQVVKLTQGGRSTEHSSPSLYLTQDSFRKYCHDLLELTYFLPSAVLMRTGNKKIFFSYWPK